MESYVRLHMIENKKRLVEMTRCNVILLSILEQNYILGDEDIQELKLDTLTDYRKSQILYDRLLQNNNKNTYPVLLLALKVTCQSGEYYILEEELNEKLATNPVKQPKIQHYVCPPPGLKEFLKNDSSSIWTSWLKPSTNTTKILIICATHIDITIEKIQDAKLEGLDEVVVVGDEKALKKIENEPKNCNLALAVMITCSTSNFLSKIGPPSKKIVIVTEESSTDVNKSFENCLDFDWNKCTKVVEDRVQWSDLTPIYSKQIMERNCLLQNTPFQLQTLLKFLGGSDDIEKKLEGSFLASLISNKSPSFFSYTLPASFQYYIQRKILSRGRISKDLFKKGLPDVFLFTGIQIHELTTLVGPSERGGRRTDTSRNQLRESNLNVRFIVLQLTKDDFQAICKKTTAPVHWLHYQNGGFSWVKSRGSMAAIHELVDRNQKQDHLSEEEFINNLHSKNPMDRSMMPVCLSDTPGMGKSVLLASVGRNIMRMHGGKVIIFAFLTEFMAQLKVKLESESGTPLVEALIDVMARYACEHELGTFLFKEGLKAGTIKVDLLLDGYDELDVQDIPLTNECLRCITEILKTVRVIVSTRPHLLLCLENVLQTVGFNIEPFSKQDQTDFLLKFWLHKHPDENLDEDRLIRFSKHSLNILETKMSEKDKDIAGTPLLCLLIAEVYEKNAVSYSNPENKVDDDPVDLAPDEVDITCITDLFKHAINVKLRRYKEKYKIDALDDEPGLIKAHVQLSLRLLCPRKHPELAVTKDEIPLEILLKIGIVEKSSTDQVPRFIHRSFPEYFISAFAIELLWKKNEGDDDNTTAIKFVFGLVLATTRVELPFFPELVIDTLHLFATTFSLQLTAYFINSQVSALPPNNYEVASQDMESRERCDLALACAHDDHVHIFRYLLQSKFFESDQHFIVSRNFSVVAVHRSSVPLLELLQGECAQLRGSKAVARFEDPTSTLLVAVKRGVYSVFEFLCFDKKFRPTVQQSHKGKFNLLLHVSVENTRGEPDGLINQRLQIMRLLLKTNPLLILQTNIVGASALCTFDIHFKLLMELIKPEYRANLLQVTELEEKNMLHYVAGYLKSEDFHELVIKLPKNILKQLLETKDTENQTPFHNLLENCDPLDETLEWFSECGVTPKPDDFTLLEVALLNGRSSRCIDSLIRYGVNWRDVGKANEYSAIHVAAMYGSVEVVRLLLSFEIPVDTLDKDGNTPLFCAVQNTTGNQLEIVKELLKNGADLTVLNKLKQNVLHWAVREGELETVQLLLDQGLQMELDAEDEDGNTPLHIAIEWFGGESDYDVISLLVDRGANVNAKNKSNETPILKMINSFRCPNHLPTISLLKSHGAFLSKQEASLALKAIVEENYGLEHSEYEKLANDCLQNGADLRVKDQRGQNLLHYAVQAMCLRGVQLLLSLGLEPNSADDKGNTALHLLVLKSKVSEARFHVAKCLVDHDASVVNTINGKGLTPLSKFVDNSTDARDFDAKLIQLLECPGETAIKIMQLSIRRSDDNFKYFDKELALKLMERGAELGWRNVADGSTWLHLAAEKGSLDAMKFFVDQGIGPDVQDDHGNTPCHFSMRNEAHVNEVDRLRFLATCKGVQLGANLKAVNHLGESLLHWAVLYGRLPAVEYLLSIKESADVNAIGGSERGTALHYCFMNNWCLNQFQVAQLLLKNHADVNAVNASGDSVADLAIKAFQKAYELRCRQLGKLSLANLMFEEVLKLLIDYGLDMKRRNGGGSPFLHRIPSFLQPMQFHQVIEHVVSKGKEEALLLLDQSTNATVVQAAAKHFTVLDETLAKLQSCGLAL